VSSSKANHLEILNLLRQSTGSFLSGEALAEKIGISRPGVWKHIKRLKQMGYEVQSRPGLGYMLTAIPDCLSDEEIVPHLSTRWLAHSYHHLTTVGSTNDYALMLAAEGAPHGAVVVAEEQTKGRGRLKREWMSFPNQGIYLSMLLRDLLPTRVAPQTSFIGSLAMVKMLKETFGICASIKWPNDVLIQGRKVAGILTETQSDQDFSRFIVVGIGINVNHGRQEMEGPFRYPATSIAIETGLVVKRQKVLLEFLGRFENEYERFLKGGLPALLPEIEQYSDMMGKTITVVYGDRQIVGKAIGISAEGALLLLRENGAREHIWAGDVMHIEGGL
jgi:BirA family biotin operon repressor/biotin-[acetyl-CoA-carboxylase] ligase